MLNFVILTLKVLSELRSSCTFLFTSVLVSSDRETWVIFPFESFFCSCPFVTGKTKVLIWQSPTLRCLSVFHRLAVVSEGSNCPFQMGVNGGLLLCLEMTVWMKAACALSLHVSFALSIYPAWDHLPAPRRGNLIFSSEQTMERFKNLNEVAPRCLSQPNLWTRNAKLDLLWEAVIYCVESINMFAHDSFGHA